MDLKVSGAGELVNRLSRFDREVYVVLQREVREATRLVADDAKTRLPSTKVLYGGALRGEVKSQGWGPWGHKTGENRSFGSIQMVASVEDHGYDHDAAVKSIKVGSRKYKRSGSYVGIIGRVTMSSPGAVLWALIGKKPNGSRFERAVVGNWPTDVYPRALGPARDAKGPEAGDRIDAALDRAKSSIGL